MLFTKGPADTFAALPHAPAPMRASIRRRLDMLHRTLQHVDDHPTLWSTRAALARNVETVRAGTATLEKAGVAQKAGDATGMTQDKEDARDIAEARLGALGEAAEAYGIESGDDGFRAAAAVPRSEWDVMSDADFFSRAEVALSRIEQALPDLDDYEVTETDVADARDAVEAARPLRGARDAHAAGRTAATDTLGATYSTVVPALDVLDRLVPRLVRDAVFVDEYHVVRRVTDD